MLSDENHYRSNDNHFMSYIEFNDHFIKKYKCNTDSFGNVKDAYIPNEQAMTEYKILCARGRSYDWNCENNILKEMTEDSFRGPDWYFFDGYHADSYGPGLWWFETLTEKKEKFNKFCEEHPYPNEKE